VNIYPFYNSVTENALIIIIMFSHFQFTNQVRIIQYEKSVKLLSSILSDCR